MRILVTNDDGVRSRGIEALAAALAPLGEVWVVAPDREQSAASHSISLHRPLRLQQLGPRTFAVDGTPSDAVYLGVHHVLRDARPDLVASGVNHGANLADDITYSGTVAAAMEAAMMGLPAMAVSLCARGPALDFGPAARFAHALASGLAGHRLAPGVLLNVNVPAASDGTRWRATRQGRRSYGAGVVEALDPRGRPYYWIAGDELAHADLPGSDANAVLDEGVVSVTPLHMDFTEDAVRRALADWELPGARRVGETP